MPTYKVKRVTCQPSYFNLHTENRTFTFTDSSKYVLWGKKGHPNTRHEKMWVGVV